MAFSVLQMHGSRYDDFRVLDTIYRSQTGAVLHAKLKKTEKEYVLKQRASSELGKMKDISNEVKLLQKLNHPNVIQCHSHFFDELRGKRQLFIVLEYAVSHDTKVFTSSS